MFFRKTPPALKIEALSSLIDRSVTIVGEISFDKSARIDGVVRGNLTGSLSKNNVLIIGPQAEIHGDIKCNSLVILGFIQGNISASYVEIRASAKIKGDVTYETIEMYQGSELNGHLFRLQGGTVTETPDIPTLEELTESTAKSVQVN
jgi:cytoskeletal protein CcmA (bactofilin family)